ncbi:TRAP transporter small permease [Nocardiopsis sp. NPDC055551]
MESLKKFLDTCLYWIVVVLFALLTVIVVWQVFSRQVLSDPATWTDEGARMSFVWLGLFASAYVFGERGHIAVEYLARKTPAGIERSVAVGVQLVVLAFALIILVWGGWAAAQNAWSQQLSALPFTYGHMYLAMPITGVLVTFYALHHVRGLLTGAEEPYTDVAEDDPEIRQEKYVPDSVLLTEVDRSPGSPGSPADEGVDGSENSTGKDT